MSGREINSLSDRDINLIHHILTSSGAYGTMTDEQILQTIRSGKKVQENSSLTVAPSSASYSYTRSKTNSRMINDNGIIYKSYGGKVIKFESTFKFIYFPNEYLKIDNGMLKLINEKARSLDVDILRLPLNPQIYIFINDYSTIVSVYSQSAETISMFYFNKDNITSHKNPQSVTFNLGNGSVPKMITCLPFSAAVLMTNNNTYVFTPLDKINNNELDIIKSNNFGESYYQVFDPIIKIYKNKSHENPANRSDYLFYVTDEDFLLLGIIEFYNAIGYMDRKPRVKKYTIESLSRRGLRLITSELYQQIKELTNTYIRKLELSN